MIIFLRIFFVIILLSMLAVTGWASSQCALWAVPREVATHPWFIATLFDAYWGFLTFYCWVAWKEATWTGRILWLVAILLLGNIAMALYALVQLFKVPTSATFFEALTTRRTR
ncbi:MAG: DUF1475 family protein [Prosthecobacter sp.]